ncbi:hypothetical protein CALVIDRAFT_534218 [Calocera viscosa TUFC12733]|uniref:Proteasome assembly chaperone 2 n=1 Tax=Calocera viscosa (strain TUFC12733) TaxID=1330018 RepID=A0A167QIN7_CALVF|nr:hypothetical protein CALVIDRAFT_534218 [Calocera viscosa TUFC12733]
MPASLTPKPIVSVGNIGQLAADLLIASLRLDRQAMLDPSCLIPVAGGREEGEGVTTPLEVFGKPSSGVVVLQQRSPALSAQKTQFVEQLTSFIRSAQFSRVLVLTGVDVVAREDRHMSSPIYHFAPPSSGSPGPFLDRLTLTTPSYLRTPSEQLPPVPGSGLTRRVLGSLAEAALPGLAVGVLLQFVMEGDNRGDARFLAQVAAKVVDVPVPEWTEPPSWRVGLFGTPQEQTLYG